MERAKKSEKMRRTWEKYRYVALVVALGVVLLLWPGREQAHDQTAREQVSTLADIQTEMADILSKISGVGQLQLMLTVESDSEKQLAQDTDLSYSGETAAPEDYSRHSETVVVNGDRGNEAVVTKNLSPVYRGALVVCGGGDRAEVQLAVTQAVSALTGLSSEKIMVIKWQ